MKLGLVTIALQPNPWAGGAPFLQELYVATAAVNVSAGAAFSARVWAAAATGVIGFVADSLAPTALAVTFRVWRTTRAPVPALSAQWNCLDYTLNADALVDSGPTAIAVRHDLQTDGLLISEMADVADVFALNMKVRIGLCRISHPLLQIGAVRTDSEQGKGQTDFPERCCKHPVSSTSERRICTTSERSSTNRNSMQVPANARKRQYRWM